MTSRLNANSRSKNRSKPKRWSDAFTPTNAGMGVWHNKAGLAPITELAHSWDGQAFADGGWWYESPKYAMLGGMIFPPNYTDRVTGWAAMRFLCLRNNLVQSVRRLKGEPFKPDPEILTAVVGRRLAIYSTATIVGSPVRWASTEGPTWQWEYAEWSQSRPFDHLSEEASEFWFELRDAHIKAGILPMQYGE